MLRSLSGSTGNVLQADQALGSGLESCLKPLDELPGGDDGDALVAADSQQVLAIPGDDQLGSRGHGRGDDVIIIGIVGHHARHTGRRDQADKRGVLRHQLRDAGSEGFDAPRKLRIAQRVRQLVEQNGAAVKLDLPSRACPNFCV